MRLVAFISILVLLGLQMRFTLVHLNFQLNREFIADTHCLEKDVEESTCNGSCHLKKELAKVQAPEEGDHGAPVNLPKDENNIDYTAVVVEGSELEMVLSREYPLDVVPRILPAHIDLLSPPPESASHCLG